MRTIWIAAAAAGLAFGSLAAAAPKPAPAPALSADEQAAIRDASVRGALLYAYDQAAWHGTDALREKLPDFASRVGGWIVDGPAEAPELVFFDRDKAAPHAVFVADFRDGKLVSSRTAGPGEPELSPERKRLIAARAAGIEAVSAKGIQRCAEGPMNSVVLPPSGSDARILVYLLTPQTDLNVIPFGGHYRAAVMPDGTVGDIRPFTNSCIALPRPPKGGSQPEALVIRHLLDPVPTEIHVFSSLVAKVPVMVVGKDGRLWLVNGPTILLAGRVGER